MLLLNVHIEIVSLQKVVKKRKMNNVTFDIFLQESCEKIFFTYCYMTKCFLLLLLLVLLLLFFFYKLNINKLFF